MSYSIENIADKLDMITEDISIFSEDTLKVYNIKLRMRNLREFLASIAEDGWTIVSGDLKEGCLIDCCDALALTYHDTLTVCQVRHPCDSVAVVDRYRIIYNNEKKRWTHIGRLEENNL